MVGYGELARVKTDWLNIADTQSDTQLTNLLDVAARMMDAVLRKYFTVPLTGSDITDEVKRINEQWTAGLFLTAQAQTLQEREHPWVAMAKVRLDEYIAYHAEKLHVKATAYKTDYLKREEDDEGSDLVK